MLWKFNSIYNPQRQYEEHLREVKYAMKPPHMHTTERPKPSDLYVHMPEKGVRSPPIAAASVVPAGR